jgi:hypothetical protein
MFPKNILKHYFGGVDLEEKPCKKMSMELKQIERPLPIEIDDEPELIDLSALFTSTSDENLLKLNERIIVEQPVEWWINESGGSFKQYKDGRLEGQNKGISKYRQLCVEFPRDTSYLWRTVLGERVKPTQVSSLLSQNLNDTPRPPNFCYKWDQPDEGYYKARAKEGLAEFIADTTPNYYCVPEDSDYRYLFKCPERKKIIAASYVSASPRFRGSLEDGDDDWSGCDNFDYGGGSFEPAPPKVHWGDILIHVHPKTGQATYICPRCSHNNNKKLYGGTGRPVKHSIDRELRARLSEADIIPAKEYKNKDRTVEIDAIIELVSKFPHGISYYKIDKILTWPKGTAERLIEKYLKNKVVVRQGKHGKPKRVYLA